MSTPQSEILQTHPLCELLPNFTDEEYRDLVDTIEQGQKNGEPLPEAVLYDGMILDGRHRYRACQELGLKCQFVLLPAGSDPRRFVIQQNVMRRHLTLSQRAMSLVRLAQWRKSGRPANNERADGASTTAELALQAGVSERTIIQAKRVCDQAPEQIKRAVSDGKISINRADQALRKPKPTNEKPPIRADLPEEMPPAHSPPAHHSEESVSSTPAAAPAEGGPSSSNGLGHELDGAQAALSGPNAFPVQEGTDVKEHLAGLSPGQIIARNAELEEHNDYLQALADRLENEKGELTSQRNELNAEVEAFRKQEAAGIDHADAQLQAFLDADPGDDQRALFARREKKILQLEKQVEVAEHSLRKTTKEMKRWQGQVHAIKIRFGRLRLQNPENTRLQSFWKDLKEIEKNFSEEAASKKRARAK